MSAIIVDQTIIDNYYDKKKKELKMRMINFVYGLKRINKTQRNCLI